MTEEEKFKQMMYEIIAVNPSINTMLDLMRFLAKQIDEKTMILQGLKGAGYAGGLQDKDNF